MRFFTFLITVSLLAGLTACASRQVQPSPGAVDPDDVMGTLSNRQPEAAFAGKADIRMETRHQKQSATLHFLAQPADRFRGDITTVFGIPLANLVVQGDEFAYFEQGENRFITGRVGDARGLMLIPLKPSELMTLVTGIPPLNEYEPEPLRVDERADHFRVLLRGREGGELAMRVDKGSLLVRELIFSPENIRVMFHRYRDTERGPVPEEVSIGTLDKQVSATVRLGSWNFSPHVDAETFVLMAPPGAEQYRIFPKGATPDLHEPQSP